MNCHTTKSISLDSMNFPILKTLQLLTSEYFCRLQVRMVKMCGDQSLGHTYYTAVVCYKTWYVNI